MSDLVQGTRLVRFGINYRDRLRGFNPDAFASRIHTLVAARLGEAGALVEEVAVNPFVQVYRIGPRWTLRGALALHVLGPLSRRTVAALIATAFREAGAGSGVNALELARYLDEGRAATLPSTNDFGEVSMSDTPLERVPESLAPLLGEPGWPAERWQHTTQPQPRRAEPPPAPEHEALPGPPGPGPLAPFQPPGSMQRRDPGSVNLSVVGGLLVAAALVAAAMLAASAPEPVPVPSRSRRSRR